MAVTGTPGSGDDTLTGDGADDTVAGQQGNDTISGGGGNDTIHGDVLFAANGPLDSNQNDNSWSPGTVTGWYNSGSGGTIERWGDGFLGLSTADGSAFIELDGNTAGVDHVQTDVELADGVTYVLSFDHAARAGGSVNDDFEVTHNGTVIATISPSSTGFFTTTTLTLTGLTGTDTIGFREFASQDNGLGPLLDNIQFSLTPASVAASGHSFNDILDGGAGDDKIYGQEGDDRITGGADDDYLEGGSGSDTFVYADGSGSDVIKDFTIGEDLLDVSALNNGSGQTVGNSDVVVTSDGEGGSILTFPNGETIRLVGVDPSSLDTPEELAAIGIHCFLQGTGILTPYGERRIEDLKVGDEVLTRDAGAQEIRWIGRRLMNPAHLNRNPHLRPICIGKDTLGPGSPVRDLWVSPQHRCVVSGAKAEMLFAAEEVFVPAKSMTDLPGCYVSGREDVVYFHILFDSHQLVMSDGLLTESFYPGAAYERASDQKVRDEICEIFPEMADRPYACGPTCLPSLTVREGRLLLS